MLYPWKPGLSFRQQQKLVNKDWYVSSFVEVDLDKSEIYHDAYKPDGHVSTIARRSTFQSHAWLLSFNLESKP